MRKDRIWLVTLTICLAALILFPGFRIITGVLVAAHIPVFIRGIFNIRSGFFCPVLYKTVGTKRIALTFDDGPDPSITPEILDLLDRFGFKATFFVIGRRAAEHPDLVKNIIEKKHVIACHDLTHSYFSNFRFSKRMIRDISESREIIFKIIGKRPVLYRPPVGLTNPHLNKALDDLGLTCIGWEKSVKDAGNRRPNTFKNFSQMTVPGAVILLHDCMPDISNKKLFLNELENLFIEIEKKGFECVGIDRMFGIKAYE